MKVLSFEEIIQRNAENVARHIAEHKASNVKVGNTITGEQAVGRPGVNVTINYGMSRDARYVVVTSHAVAIDSSDEQAYGRVVANSARRVIRQHRKEIEALKDK